MATIAGNLQAIKARIAAASAAVGRDPASVTLLAVSKTHPAALLAEACAAGQRAFGENYVQEAVAKMEAALAKAPWIAGEGYSLADIALLFMARAMRVATPEILNAKAAPKTWAWLKKMERRRAVKDVLATARRAEPDKLFMPGPEPARWG